MMKEKEMTLVISPKYIYVKIPQITLKKNWKKVLLFLWRL